MSKTLFTGCSYTAGYGWELERHDPNLWTNILHKNNSFLKNTEQVNLGIPGASNLEIFTETARALVEHQPMYALVEWTSYPRYNVLLSVETYNSHQRFTANTVFFDQKFNDVTYTKKYLGNIRDRFFSLHNPHLDIVNIVKYTNILINLSKLTNTKIFFINGMCHWDNGYFNVLQNVLPNQYTPYTQSILNCDNRDDSEIFKLYDKIHQEYFIEGGIQSQHWLNLYSSMRSKMVDVNPDGVHPGKLSNINFFDLVNQQLHLILSS